jgi:hypothetical protein
MDGQKVIKPGAGGKTGGHDDMILDKAKSVGPAAKPEDGKGQGCLDGQKTK